MDGFEFVASLVQSLAWPAAVVIVATIFRRPIRRLIDRMAKRVGKMTEVRAWQVRAKFAEKTTQVNQEIAAEASTIDPPIPPSEDAPDYSTQSPREIVMLAWMELEERLSQAAEVVGMKRSRGPVWLWTKQYLPPEINQRVRDLHKLRNEAVHMRDFSVSRDSAIAYARAAENLGAIVRHPSVLVPMKNAYEASQAAKD